MPNDKILDLVNAILIHLQKFGYELLDLFAKYSKTSDDMAKTLEMTMTVVALVLKHDAIKNELLAALAAESLGSLLIERVAAAYKELPK